MNLTPLLWPKSVALVGAADDADILRGRILAVMRQHDFTGGFHPVSRSAETVQGLKAYPSVAACPEPIELAVLIIPAHAIAEELERCGEAGVKAALVLASGFAEEPGEEGARMQARIADIARQYGMIVSGPNSEGFANLATKLCATFSPAMETGDAPLVPPWRQDGHVAVVAQSGGVGFSFFDRGRPKMLPFSHVFTTGNEACLESLQVVDHLLDDDRTGVILMFLEDIKTPELFRPVAEKAMRAGKPIIVAKIGRSEAGVRAAQSHTGALAGAHAAYQAMFRRYGIIEGLDQDHMVDLALGFSYLGDRLPAGDRVGIFTASGGNGGWMADAAVDAGLRVPEMDAETRAIIDPHLPSYGTSQNPVDGTAQVIRQQGYARMIEMIAQSPSIDAVIAVCTGRNRTGWEREREQLMRVGSELGKPALLWSYTLPSPEVQELASRAGFPLYTNLRNCTQALAAMANYRAFREDFLKSAVVAPETGAEARAAAGAVLAAAGLLLPEAEARAALAPYGICPAAGPLATTAEEAARLAPADGPAVLKVQSPDIPHKTEAGALAIGVAKSEAAAAYTRITDAAQVYAPLADIQGVLVEPMAPPGLEVIIGINRDAQFGLMLLLGLGGIHVEALDDVALSPLPVDERQARALISDLKGARLFESLRGAPAADVDALADLMVKLSRFATDHAERIDEIDLNPVRVHAAGQGVSILDALIIQRSEP